jgi:hypothetical protein
MRLISYKIGYQELKPYTNSVEVHSQLSNNRHPVDGELVGAGSLRPENNKCKKNVDNFIFFMSSAT